MFGPDINDPLMMGIIPRAVAQIFQHIDGAQDGEEFTIRVSFMEIYREQVKDLLCPSSGNLKVRETPARGVWVEGITEKSVINAAEVMECLRQGAASRSTSATQMNDTSSRSHSLFVLSVQQKLKDGSTRSGKLNLADLAGSEKVGKTGATGATLEEAKKINQSLSALGNCINALSSSGGGASNVHIPYRDSKLTFILRESLGGNTKTKLMVCASMHEFNLEETVSTLRFAQRAKAITTKVTVNMRRSVEELEAMVLALTRELEQVRRYVTQLEGEIAQSLPQVSLDDIKKRSAQLASPRPGGQSAAIVAPVANDEMVNELRELVSSLEYEAASKRSRLHELELEVGEAKELLEQARQARDADQYALQNAQLEIQAQKMAAAASEDRCTALGKNLSDVQSEMQALKNALQREREMREATQEKLREVTQQQENMAQQMRVLTAERAAAIKEAEAQRKLQAELTTKVEAQANEMGHLEKQVRAAQSRAEHQHREHELVERALREELATMRESSSETDAKRATQESEFRAQNLALQQKALQQEDELAAAVQKVDDLSRAREQDAARLQRLEDERNGLVGEAQRTRDAHAAEIAQLHEEIADLKTLLRLRAREASQTNAQAAQQHQAAVVRYMREVDSLRAKLQAARGDLDLHQVRYLMALKQREQRDTRVASLEGELHRRNVMVRELKEDLEAAVQLNIENAAKFQVRNFVV